ncbi:hypothetical protein JZU71_03445, partial [bacterium]|nr:hypothetical protein [bacterium]
MNIADRTHFQIHVRQDSDKLYIAAPRVNQVAGASSIFLSRRLNGPNGNFAGIVSISLNVDYISRE